MSIQRINEFPEGSGSLSSDDVFLFMDDPSKHTICWRRRIQYYQNRRNNEWRDVQLWCRRILLHSLLRIC
jgi:hypothetical protein